MFPALVPPVPSTPALSLRDVINRSAEFFAAKGIASPRLDAELLVGEAAGMDRLKLYMNLDRPMDSGELERAREMVRRRAAREPVAYILGRREFGSRSFVVNKHVLIPRPETELLVEQTESELSRRFPDNGSVFRVLEFGVGSGAIAVTLAANLVGTEVIATEISTTAAAVARSNSDRHGVSERVAILEQDDFQGIAGQFHAIVSNPPYVNPATLPDLEPEVANHEPHGALFAEERGLQWYRFLTRQSAPLLEERGFLALEIGFGQAKAIREIAEQAGWKVVSVTRDYGGIERVMTLERIVLS